MRRRLESGFSLIEMLIVLSIISILVRASLPGVAAIQRGAVASQVMGDFNTLRAAAVAQYEATGSYPADATQGAMPAGMAPYLPRNFSFVRPHYQLDWDNWAVQDTTGGANTSGEILALTLVTPDSLLARETIGTLGSGCTHWTVGDATTFVIFSTLESHP